MPFLVVPSSFLPLEFSLISSRSLWIGKIKQILSAIYKLSSLTSIPCSLRLSISLISAHGSKTTPLPIAHFLLLIIPEGNKLSL